MAHPGVNLAHHPRAFGGFVPCDLLHSSGRSGSLHGHPPRSRTRETALLGCLYPLVLYLVIIPQGLLFFWYVFLLVRFPPVFLVRSERPPFARSGFAFSKERFVLPRVTVREAGEGSRLSGLVLTFVYAAGDIVRVRSDPVCETWKMICGGRSW